MKKLMSEVCPVDVMVDAIEGVAGLCHYGVLGMIKELKREYIGRFDCDDYALKFGVFGGSVANLMMGRAVINDIDLYVVVNSSLSGWPTNVMGTHTAGKYEVRVQQEDYDGTTYWNSQIEDKTYKVRRSYRRGIFNVIEVVCHSNIIPSAKAFASSFDLSCCQAGFWYGDDKVSGTDKFWRDMYYVKSRDVIVTLGCYDSPKITIENWHTPIQSLFRAMNKADELGYRFDLEDHIGEVYQWWYGCNLNKQGHVFSMKKYLDIYFMYQDQLDKYFTIGLDRYTDCYIPLWNFEFEKKQIDMIVKAHVERKSRERREILDRRFNDPIECEMSIPLLKLVVKTESKKVERSEQMDKKMFEEAKWFTWCGIDAIKGLRHVEGRKHIWVDADGFYYHEDECDTGLCGRFSTLDDAIEALRQYGYYLEHGHDELFCDDPDGSKAESDIPNFRDNLQGEELWNSHNDHIDWFDEHGSMEPIEDGDMLLHAPCSNCACRDTTSTTTSRHVCLAGGTVVNSECELFYSKNEVPF